MADYYQTLGIDRTASQEEIKKAYRKLVRQHHPDRGGDAKRMKEINMAYQILGDKKKKEQYDKFGGTFGEQGSEAGGFDFNSFQQDAGFDFNGINLDDILENLTGFGFGFNRQKEKRNMNRGEDIEIAVKLELEDILQGLEKTLYLSKMTVCSRCQGKGGEPHTKVKECFSCRGKGWVEQVRRTILGAVSRKTVCPECGGEGKIPEKPCNVCRGQGRIENQEELKINIPAGVDTGQVLRVEDKGNAGKKGDSPGDLFIKIFVKPHKVFQRKGDDLFASIPISFSAAVLGGEIEIPTLENKKLSLKVPPGTMSGKILRLSGKGIPHFNSWGRGAMFVELNIKTPKKLTRKQKDLLKQLQNQGL